MNSIKISWSVKDISIKCYLLSAVSRQPNEFKCLFDTVGLHKPNKNGNFSTGNALFGRKVFVCVSGFHEPADVVDRRILISNSIGEFFNKPSKSKAVASISTLICFIFGNGTLTFNNETRNSQQLEQILRFNGKLKQLWVVSNNY